MSYRLVKIGSNSGDILVASEEETISQIEFNTACDAFKARDEMGLGYDWLPIETENVQIPD